jgi:hypothetical protein
VFRLDKSAEGNWNLVLATDPTKGISAMNSENGNIKVNETFSDLKIDFTTVTEQANAARIYTSDDTTPSRYIQYNYNSGNDRFGNYGNQTSFSADKITPIHLYKLVMDETPEISDFTSVAADQEYYMIGNATIRFRHGNDLWIYDDSGNTIHAVMQAGEFEEGVESGYTISNFKLTNISTVVNKVYNANMVYVPQTVTKPQGDVASITTTLGTGQELTDENVGQAVIVSGYLSNSTFETDKIKFNPSLESNSSYYTLVKYLDVTVKETSAQKAPSLLNDDDESQETENTWVWAAYKDAWLTEAPAAVNGTLVYVGGMVDKTDADGLVIYPVSMATKEDTVVSVKGVTFDEETYLIGRDLYLPEGAALFTVNGTRVATDNLANGIYIIRYANGSAAKILVR